ncbi:helix-turn-helix domain-containing protein [Micromonospora cathayae]|uniref:Helix-turn-helix domain-containing protein n=1 Tax=Micromonospora cathayae TaxID=3028804 RepID=A0ABY7ZWS1_9ACTN|nr:helix-turn-helix domain-containing protein [Micromonospora sp. HUAS 3]WDZ87271.1 helix-turn-helix domain-containing protein [Micromonospora sp. HUAS 3]
MALPDRLVPLGALLRDIAADQRIVDEMVEAARTGSPEIARLPWAENRRHVAALLAAGLSSFERLTDPTERDFAEARRLGAARAAQGVSVTGLLRGVQAARRVVVETALGRGRAAGIPDTALLEGLLDLDRYAGALERALVDGYHAAERELAHTEQDARNRVLRTLLAAGPGDRAADGTAGNAVGGPAGGAVGPAGGTAGGAVGGTAGGSVDGYRADLVRIGLRPDGSYHCVVTDVTDPARIRTAERRLSRCGAVFGTVDDRLTGLSPHRPAADAFDGTTLVVVAPARPLADLAAVHGLCAAALRAATEAGLRGRHGLVDLAGETALAAQPALADLLSTTMLAALDPADGFHRQLASTALVYLDHGQRLDHTAAALHLHPNTVRYRLRRFQELVAVPPPLAEPGGGRWSVLVTVRWWWALRTWLAGAEGDGTPASRLRR